MLGFFFKILQNSFLSIFKINMYNISISLCVLSSLFVSVSFCVVFYSCCFFVLFLIDSIQYKDVLRSIEMLHLKIKKKEVAQYHNALFFVALCCVFCLTSYYLRFTIRFS